MKKLYLYLFILLSVDQLSYAASAEANPTSTKQDQALTLIFRDEKGVSIEIPDNAILVDQQEPLSAYKQRSLNQGNPKVSVFLEAGSEKASDGNRSYYSGAAQVSGQLPTGTFKRYFFEKIKPQSDKVPTQAAQPAVQPVAPVATPAENPGKDILKLLQQPKSDTPKEYTRNDDKQNQIEQQVIIQQQQIFDLKQQLEQQKQQQQLQQQQLQQQLGEQVLRLQKELNAAKLANQNLFDQTRKANEALSQRPQKKEIDYLKAQLEDQRRQQEFLQSQLDRLLKAEASQDPQKIAEAINFSFMGPSIIDTSSTPINPAASSTAPQVITTPINPAASAAPQVVSAPAAPVTPVMQQVIPAAATPTAAAAPQTTYVRPAGPTAAHKPPKPDPRPVISAEQLEQYIKDGIPTDDLMDMGVNPLDIKRAAERIQEREAWENLMIQQAEQERIATKQEQEEQIKADQELARALQASDVLSDDTSKKGEGKFTVVQSKGAQGRPTEETKTNAQRNRDKREREKEKRRLAREAEAAKKAEEKKEAARLAKIAEEEAEIAAAQEEALKQVLVKASSDKARKERLERLTLAGKLEPQDPQNQESKKSSAKKKKSKNSDDKKGGAGSVELTKEQQEKEDRMLAAAAKKEEAARRQALQADPVNLLPFKQQQNFRFLTAKQNFTIQDIRVLQRYVNDEKNSVEIRILAARALLKGKLLSRDKSAKVDQEFLDAGRDAATLCSQAKDYQGIEEAIKKILSGTDDISRKIEDLNFYIDLIKKNNLLSDDPEKIKELEASINALTEAEAARKAPQLAQRFDNPPAQAPRSEKDAQLDNLHMNLLIKRENVPMNLKLALTLFFDGQLNENQKQRILGILTRGTQSSIMSQDDKELIERNLRYIHIIAGTTKLNDRVFMENYRAEELEETFDTNLLNKQLKFVSMLLEDQKEPIAVYQALEFAEQVLPLIAYHTGILTVLDPTQKEDETIGKQVSYNLVITLDHLLRLTQERNLSLIKPLIKVFAQLLLETLSTTIEGEEPLSFERKEEILRKLQELIEKSS